MIGMQVIPQPGANYVSISEEFYKRVEQIKKDMPQDIKVDVLFDSSKYIKRSIAEVEETLIISLVLVVLIIYIFFRDWIIAIRPLIDIPVSLIGAFFIMYLMGYTINVLTLLAIVLATGLVVDDGIVVTENIYKKMERGMNKWQAAHGRLQRNLFRGYRHFYYTGRGVFAIVFLEGFVGSLFREFGIVVGRSSIDIGFCVLDINTGTKRKDDEKRSTQTFLVL